MKKERQDATVTDSDGVEWRCAWMWESERYPRPKTTQVYLRKLDDGPGDHTHEVTAEKNPDIFKAGYIDGTCKPHPRSSMGTTFKFA